MVCTNTGRVWGKTKKRVGWPGRPWVPWVLWLSFKRNFRGFRGQPGVGRKPRIIRRWFTPQFPEEPCFFAGELGLPSIVSTRERTTTSQRIGDNPRFQRHQRCLAGIAECGAASVNGGDSSVHRGSRGFAGSSQIPTRPFPMLNFRFMRKARIIRRSSTPQFREEPNFQSGRACRPRRG